MPMIAQVCHHPCCSQVAKSCGCLTSEHTATLSRRCHHPYCSQLEKAVEVCLATTKSTWRAISHAFVLYRELVSELFHVDLDGKFTNRIALRCPSLAPTDN
jgi:hypothetical protein